MPLQVLAATENVKQIFTFKNFSYNVFVITTLDTPCVCAVPSVPHVMSLANRFDFNEG